MKKRINFEVSIEERIAISNACIITNVTTKRFFLGLFKAYSKVNIQGKEWINKIIMEE